jgi:hypothetical protein
VMSITRAININIQVLIYILPITICIINKVLACDLKCSAVKGVKSGCTMKGNYGW